MKLSEARKILGIEKTASKDEILKRYDIILKKYKNTNIVDGVKVEDVNDAYNVLMGYDLSNKPDMKPTEPSFFSKMWAKLLKLDPVKVDTFFLYNKYKIIAGIIGFIFIFSLVKSIVTRVDPDLYFTSVGQITITEPEKVQESIKSKIPELKAPMVEAMYLGPNDQGEQAYAMAMKVTTVLAAGDMDVILVDKEKYESLAKQGAFVKIEDLSKSTGIDLPKEQSLLVKPDEGLGDEAVYGIDVTTSKFLGENNIKGNKIIMGVRINAKHMDSAVKLFKIIYESTK